MSYINFHTVAAEIATLVTQKQEAYGDSFGRSQEIINILYPQGIKPDQYHDFLAIIRVVDKLFRIANKKNSFSESPWHDIAGYALLSSARITEDR